MVALAGPVSNLLMAVFWALIIRLGATIGGSTESIAGFLINSGKFGILINLSLALLNLLPIPPLDGSRVVTAFLPYNLAVKYNQLERYGFIILLALLYFDKLGAILQYPFDWLIGFFKAIAGAQ